MRTVSRSALVPYTAPQMYELVKDVEAYPSFLPWCNDAEVHLREPHVIEASLELHHRGISKRFRTRNALRENESLHATSLTTSRRHLKSISLAALRGA